MQSSLDLETLGDVVDSSISSPVMVLFLFLEAPPLGFGYR